MLTSRKVQLETTHYEFIDRYPLPDLRTRMIELADTFSAEEFISDLFSMPTFTIKPGSVSWDPSAWVPTPEFKARWGFLLGLTDERGLTEELKDMTLISENQRERTVGSSSCAHGHVERL